MIGCNGNNVLVIIKMKRMKHTEIQNMLIM